MDGDAPGRETPAIAAAIADLAERLGVAEEVIDVLEDRAVTWPDGSFGCPQPGMSYLQRLTPGRLVVLGAGQGRRFEYHAGPSGKLRYCAVPRPPIDDGRGGAE